MARMLSRYMCIVLLIFFKCRIFVLSVNAVPSSLSSNSDLPPRSAVESSAILNPRSKNQTEQEEIHSKVLIRKCCGPGQVYQIDPETQNKQCIKYSITSSSSLATKPNERLFLASDDQLPLNFSMENFQVIEGSPLSCSPDLYLRPDIYMADQFFTVGSGQLVVPHRFWYFQLEDYCMEEYFRGENFSKGRKIAEVCSENFNKFPSSAIDSNGKLSLDFFQPPVPKELLSINGKKVVRKCCDRDEVASRTSECFPNQQGYTTEYADGLFANNPEIFLQIGFPICSFHQHTSQFHLTSSGSLMVELKLDSSSLNQTNTRLFSPESYCIDDFIFQDPIGLLQVKSMAAICSEDESFNLIVSDTFYTDPPYLDEIIDENLSKINIPKCCSINSIVVDENSCEPFKSPSDVSLPVDLMVSQGLNYYLLSLYNISSSLIPNTSLSCNFGHQYPLKILNETDGTLLVSPIGSNDLSVSFHYYIENLWDYQLEIIKPYCIDISLLRYQKSIEFLPQVFYCSTSKEVSLHLPIFFSLSTLGLIITIVIYFIVPTSGSAKLVTNVGGARKKRGTPTMAMMLTGRILLCHIFSLTLAFICFVLSQIGIVSKGTTGCIVLGFISYGALVASFSWLTVYCFDYCRIFRGSFKVSNDVLFLPYSAFGWGVPILLLIATAVTQFQFARYGIPRSVIPNMGVVRCWFSGGTSSLFFFYIPLSILLLFNIGFFVSLLFNRNLMNCMKKGQKLSLRTNQNSLKGSKEVQDIKMALKLFFITGVPWIFEIIAWIPQFSLSGKRSEGNWYNIFEISNLLNSLRGVIVFLVFVVFQRDVRRYLVTRFWRIFFKKEISKSTDPSRANEMSSTSQPSTSNSRSTSGLNTRSSIMISDAAVESRTPRANESEL